MSNILIKQGYVGIFLFVILNFISMVIYPGGTIIEPETKGYSFFYNFLSNLGESTAKNGEDIIAHDANGNVVSWDASAVATKTTELENAFKLEELRTERNKRLAETDHYGLSDQTMSSDMTTYRQALRDITDSATSLDDVTWPTKP